jgi:large repetitive protein
MTLRAWSFLVNGRRHRGATLAALLLVSCAGGEIAEQPAYVTNQQGERVEELAMTTPRADQSAAALQNGRVLIAGGTTTGNVGGVTSSAEIYDPNTQSFTATGSMTVARQGATVTLLNDGRVLLAGGVQNVGFRAELSSAELYDPVAGTFAATGSMQTPREGHTATLLRDGRVLVAGGSDNGVHTLDSAEIYDPRSGAWHFAGHMTVPRVAHVAVLLGSGQVLIAGGGRGDMPGGYIVYQSAETYSPELKQFSRVPAPMKNDRVGAAALLLNDGRALIVGGKSGKVLTSFGPGTLNLNSLAPLNTAETYDPESGSFVLTGNLQAPHYLPRLVKLQDGNVLVTSGWKIQGPVVAGMADAEVFLPATSGFSGVAPMHVARLQNSSTLLPDGNVLVAGGVDGNSLVTASVEFYDSRAHRFVARGAGSTPPASAKSSVGAAE